MAPSKWIVLFALLIALLAACDKLTSPTAPDNELSASASARAASNGCPQSYEPITAISQYYDPAVDRNGDGTICVKINVRSARLPPKVHLTDNNPRRGGPSTAALDVTLEQDL